MDTTVSAQDKAPTANMNVDPNDSLTSTAGKVFELGTIDCAGYFENSGGLELVQDDLRCEADNTGTLIEIVVGGKGPEDEGGFRKRLLTYAMETGVVDFLVALQSLSISKAMVYESSIVSVEKKGDIVLAAQHLVRSGALDYLVCILQHFADLGKADSSAAQFDKDAYFPITCGVVRCMRCSRSPFAEYVESKARGMAGLERPPNVVQCALDSVPEADGVLDADPAGLNPEYPLRDYQRRNIATMLELEAPDRTVANPMVLRFPCPAGLFLIDLANSRLSVFQSENDVNGLLMTVPAMRGGIQCSNMGCGKSLMCMGLVLATKGAHALPPRGAEVYYPANPVEKTSLGCLWRVKELKQLAAEMARSLCSGNIRDVLTEEARLQLDMLPLGFYIERREPAHYTSHLSNSDKLAGKEASIRRTSIRVKESHAQKAHTVGIREVMILLSRATLIAVPPNLLDQWAGQVNKHIEGGFLDYVVLKDNYKAWTADPAFLATKDVVFVSTDVFPELARNHSQCHPLLQVMWIRAIIDEGHVMNSTKADRVLGASLLRTNVLWLCTGTPTTNTSLGEDMTKLQKVIHFLNQPPFNDKANWNLVDSCVLGQASKSTAMLALSNALRNMCVRQRHYELPPCNVANVPIKLMAHEWQRYYEICTLVTVNIITSEGTGVDSLLSPENRVYAEKNVKNLRQACLHVAESTFDERAHALDATADYLAKDHLHKEKLARIAVETEDERAERLEREAAEKAEKAARKYRSKGKGKRRHDEESDDDGEFKATEDQVELLKTSVKEVFVHTVPPHMPGMQSQSKISIPFEHMPYDSPEEALARRRIRIEEKRMLAEEKKKRAALRKAMKRAEDAAAVAMLHDDRRVYSGMDVHDMGVIDGEADLENGRLDDVAAEILRQTAPQDAQALRDSAEHRSGVQEEESNSSRLDTVVDLLPSVHLPDWAKLSGCLPCEPSESSAASVMSVNSACIRRPQAASELIMLVCSSIKDRGRTARHLLGEPKRLEKRLAEYHEERQRRQYAEAQPEPAIEVEAVNDDGAAVPPIKRESDPDDRPPVKRVRFQVEEESAAEDAAPLRMVMSTSSSKMNYLLHRLCELIGNGNPQKNKVVVFSEVDESLAYFCTAIETLGIPYASYTNDVKAVSKRSAELLTFQTSDTPVLIASLNVAAWGVDISSANYGFFLEPLLDGSKRRQAIKRLHRKGQLRNVHIEFLYADHTLEKMMITHEWESGAVGRNTDRARTTTQARSRICTLLNAAMLPPVGVVKERTLAAPSPLVGWF